MAMDKTHFPAKWTYASIFFAVVMLPWDTSLSNAGIIAIIPFSIISFIILGIAGNILRTSSFYLITTIALFLPVLIGTIYSNDLEGAIFQVSKAIFYLLVPLMLLRKDLQREKLMKWMTIAMVIGMSSSMVYLLSRNLHTFLNSNLPWDKIFAYSFTGKKFLEPIPEMHPVYYGSYLLFFLVLLIGKANPIQKWLKWILVLLALVTVIFINSRIIFLIFLILGILFWFRLPNIKLKLYFGIGSLLSLALLAWALQSTYVFNKVTKGTQWELSEQIGTPNLSKDQLADTRMSRWKVSLDIIWDKPIFGHGTGASRGILVETYRKNQMTTSVDQQYDSHNQYLGYAIDYGIFGLCFLLWYLIGNALESVRRKDVLLGSFTLIIFIICLTENYLIRNMGINFVAIMGAVLLINRFTEYPSR